MNSSFSKNLWRNRLFLGLGVYILLVLVSRQLGGFLGGYYSPTASPSYLSIGIFSLGWFAVAMICSRLLLGKSFTPEPKLLYMYISMMALIGPVGEVFVNSVSRLLFGGSLWTYFLYPIHGGDTSLYSALFIWPYYGMYLYFLHQKIEINHTEKGYYIKPALFMAFDAITLEFLVNITSIFLLHTLIFYYFPSDVAHLTTIAAIPFYFLAGIIITRTIKRFRVDPVFFGTMSLLIAFVFVFLV